MKKMRIPLFIKVFLLLILSFGVIETYHYKIDYDNNLESLVHDVGGQLYNSYDNELVQAKSYYGIEDEKTKQIFKDLYKNKYGYHILYTKDNDVHFIDEVYNFNNLFPNNAEMIVFVDRENEVGQEQVNISQFSQVQELIEKTIQNADNQKIDVVFGKNYLEIDQQVIVDNGKEDIKQGVLDTYANQNLRYHYSHQKIQKITQEQVLSRCHSMIKEASFSGNTRMQYRFYNDDLYVSYVDEHVISIGYLENAKTLLMERTLYNKTNVYIGVTVLSVIIGLLLSYSMTRRIKKMKKATALISNNHFDVQLKETPYDELGDLAKDINQMSHKLDQTMKNLTQEIENVKKLENIRKEFITNFTHEMKTPLGIINGYIELIEEIQDEKKKQEYLQEIYKEIDFINELVYAMLNLSKLETGKVELKIEEIDIEDMLNHVVESLGYLIEKKQLKIHLKGTNEFLKADAYEIQTVIKNFLSNAIKHTPENGNIYIEYSQNGISIENEGSYLTEQQKETIWMTYISGDRQGTGLGLAICESILKLHHFQYGVNNTPRGVKFWFKKD